MNISFNAQQMNAGRLRNPGGKTSGYSFGANKTAQSEPSADKAQDMRELLRGLDKKEETRKNKYESFGQDSLSNIWKTPESTSTKKSKNEAKKKYNYNSMEVANKIRQAKTSLSAAGALRSARRKVLEVRRKLAGNTENADELQLALTHATRMEIVARKKVHNLEQEEQVELTQERDAREKELEEKREAMREDMVYAAEDEVAEAEDEIFETRDDTLIEEEEELYESGEELTEETMEELVAQVSELGEELLRELEDTMELLEDMELLDPHMSEEQLEKVKRKHRSAEEKAILKANLDYIKDTMRLHDMKADHGASISGGNTGGSFSASGSFVAAAAAPAAAPAVAVDVSV